MAEFRAHARNAVKVDTPDNKVRPDNLARRSPSAGRAPARPRYEAAPVALLLALSLLAWLASGAFMNGEMRVGLLTRAEGEPDGMGSAGMAMTLPLFMASWVVMMIAMMFPAVSPMVLTFWRWANGRDDAGRRTASLVAGYLVVWSTIGFVAYAMLQLLEYRRAASTDGAVRFAAILVVAAGAYQLTPLKSVCLRHCRTPLSVLVEHAPLLSGGSVGAFRLGLKHGAFCVGCCWSLMLVLLLLGLMNLVWMGIVAAIIFSEKALPHGVLVSRVVSVSLIGVGVAGLVAPDAFSPIR